MQTSFYLAVFLGSLFLCLASGLAEAVEDKAKTPAHYYVVKRGPLAQAVKALGDVESARFNDLRCRLSSRSGRGTAILWLVPEGARVSKDDKLVEFDSTALEADKRSQQIVCNLAEVDVIRARNAYETATLAKKEYLEGTFSEQEELIKFEIFVAEHLRQQSQADPFAVEKAKKELAIAQTRLRVLRELTKARMIKKLDGDIKAASAGLEAQQQRLRLETKELERIEDQLRNCVITAPRDGMVIYANTPGFRVEEGALMRHMQSVIHLPDLAAMQVKVQVPETQVRLLKPGLRAIIRAADRQSRGRVGRVALLPEAQSESVAGVKKYAVTVILDEQHEGLVPRMTAEVEILVGYVADAILLPVSAVTKEENQFICWVRNKTGVARRQLILGLGNDEYVEVKDGLRTGEEVILNPRTSAPQAHESSDQSHGH